MEACAPVPPEPADNASVPDHYQAILSELKKLNNPERNWAKTLKVFAITLVLFAAAGWVRYSDPVFLGMLVGVLFFHELGHFVAMRIFGYRNVRMFFIPLFGAAVSGRCFQPSGWKKAVVSLMGPFPGIVVGTVLLAPQLCGHPPQWILELCFDLLSINLFNLLPLLPFDGGRYLHAILFCRNRWLEAAFRLVASLLLGLLAWKLNSIVLGVVAYIMVGSTIASYRVSNIAHRLRGHLPKPDPKSDEIPPQAAMLIIDEIRAHLPQLKTDARIATTALNIYEEATTRPPSWIASVGLLILYPLVFLLPLAPWVVAIRREPALVQEWLVQVDHDRYAKRVSAASKAEVRSDIAPIEHRLPALGHLKWVQWTSEKMTRDSRFSPPERPAYRLRGYAQLGIEKIKEFSTYPWQPAGPEFRPTMPIPIMTKWYWSQPFTNNCKPGGSPGDLFFERRSGVVYFDIQVE